MARMRYTVEDVIWQATYKCEQKSTDAVLLFLAKEYLRQRDRALDAIEQAEQAEGLFETVVACLVKQLGGEARIPRADIEDPPELIEDDDPVDGDWIYRTECRED